MTFGRQDCTRNYNRVVTAPKIATLWNGGAGLYSTNPFLDGSCIGAWMFQQGFGNTLFDTAAFGLDGTLVNMDDNDWIAGHVPGPYRYPHILYRYTLPAVVAADSRIRFWTKSRQKGVHKQIHTGQDIDTDYQRAYYDRMAGGAHHRITDFPGERVCQVDVIQPNGLKSSPSQIVHAVVT
ncbi:hypothetical protein ES708_32683 [subsurface metagenome]